VNVFRSFLEKGSDMDAFEFLRRANKRHVMSRRLTFAAFHDNRLSSKGHTALLGVFVRLEAIAASERSAESHKRRFRDAPRTKCAGGSETNSLAPWLAVAPRRKAAAGILAFIERCPQRRLITGQINGRDEWIRRDQSHAHRTAGPRSAAEARMGRPKKPRCCCEHEVLQRFD